MISKRSDRLEILTWICVLVYMTFSGIAVQDAKVDCLEKHGVNSTLRPDSSQGPFSFECIEKEQSNPETLLNNAISIISIFSVHWIPFVLGYRVHTLVKRVRSGEDENLFSGLPGSTGDDDGN